MNATTPQTAQTISSLKEALVAPAMPEREKQNCALLIDRLARPVRIGMFGLSTGGDSWLLKQILGEDILPPGLEWPTLEVVFGPKLMTHATYEDGLTSSFAGAANDAILQEAPVFLRIEAPLAMLQRMRFLYLACDDALGDQIASLDWAEPRTDITIWCTQNFDLPEIEIWARAADGLKNHALLVTTSPIQDLGELSARVGYDFDGVYAVPQGDQDSPLLSKLLGRLDRDINEAQAADLDAARLFLHQVSALVTEEASARVASRRASRATRPVSYARPAAAAAPAQAAMATPVPAPEPAPAPQPAPAEVKVPTLHPQTVTLPAAPAAPAPAPAPVAAAAPAPAPRAPASPEIVAALSEPMLYLKRRGRALLELIEWQSAEDTPDADAWASDVLDHCCETTDGLQMRAMDWPDDDAAVLTLRRTLDEACDVAILLQVEGGTDQAQDAATMLLQLRNDFERELAA